jgi:WD40 repeat protein
MGKRVGVLWLAGAALLLGGVAPGAEDQGRIDRLVRQLGNPRFEEREGASRALERIGEPALPALRQAVAESADAEVRRRARLLVRALDRSLTELAILTKHELPVSGVAFSPNGRRLLSGGADGCARLWEADTYKELGCFKGDPKEEERGYATGVAFSPDGRRALTLARSTLRLWDLETGRQLRRFQAVKNYASGKPTFSPDGRRALTYAGNGDVEHWDLEGGRQLRRFRAHASRTADVAFLPDGRRALTCGWDGCLRLWDLETGKALRRYDTRPHLTVCAVAVSPDGRRALSGSVSPDLWEKGEVRLWDVETGQELRRFEGHKSYVYSVAFSPDGRRALSGGRDGVVRLWDVATGKELKRLEGHADWVWGVAFSPDGRRALSGSSDGTVRLWALPR